MSEDLPADLSAIGDAALARRIAAAARSAGASSASAADPGLLDTRAEEEEICRRYARPVRLYGLRHLRSVDRAEDLVQDVLFLTLRKLRAGEVREPERLDSFILGAARMLARSGQRAARREASLSPEIEESLSTTPKGGPAPLRISADGRISKDGWFSADGSISMDGRTPTGAALPRGLLVRCLEALAEPQRAVVVLTYYGEQSSEEIAASLGFTTGNVRVIRHRAMSSLRDCIGSGIGIGSGSGIDSGKESRS